MFFQFRYLFIYYYKMTDKDLQEKLKQAKKEQDQKNHSNKKYELEIERLEKSYQEQIEISAKAQRDYINLKFDFDRYQKQILEKEKEQDTNALISSVKKFLPFIEDLRKSLDNIPQDKKSDPLAQWVQLVYDNFLKILESMHIFQIKAIWLEPDALLHEPVSLMPTENKKLKWKIIQEFERGFVYKKDDKQIVINPSKVIVWQ